MKKYSEVVVIKKVKISRDFVDKVRNAYSSKKYSKIIKLVIDFYDEFVCEDLIKPNPIYLNDFYYLNKDNTTSKFVDEDVLLASSCADALMKNTNYIYKYKNRFFKFDASCSRFYNTYYNPCIVELCNCCEHCDKVKIKEIK